MENAKGRLFMKLTISRAEDSKFAEGLRGFFHYRDLGIKTGSSGEFGANVIKAVPGKHSIGDWHYHKLKDEVFYVQSGRIIVRYSTADDINRSSEKILGPGDNFHVFRGLRHQMEAIEDTELFEFSTQHFDTDSYRIHKGD